MLLDGSELPSTRLVLLPFFVTPRKVSIYGADPCSLSRWVEPDVRGGGRVHFLEADGEEVALLEGGAGEEGEGKVERGGGRESPAYIVGYYCYAE